MFGAVINFINLYNSKFIILDSFFISLTKYYHLGRHWRKTDLILYQAS